jgi:hypothetical protein
MTETAAVTTANTNGQTANTTEQQPANTGEQAQQQQAAAPIKFDDWYGKLEDPIKDLVDDHVSGLKSALTSERDERRKLAKQLTQLSKSADEGSEFQKQLQETVEKLGLAEQKAQFLEDAHQQNISNLRVAWLTVKEEKLINRDGSVDFLKLREVAPELFERKTPTPAGNAGTGNGQAGTVKPDMNKWMRQAAGRG